MTKRIINKALDWAVDQPDDTKAILLGTAIGWATALVGYAVAVAGLAVYRNWIR